MPRSTSRSSTRWALRCFLIVATVAVSGTAAAQDLWIRNVNVVDVRAGEVVPARDVRIDAGRISAIVEATESSSDALDGGGGFLVPGLWDAHVHLANDPASPLAPERQLDLYLRHGVTGVRDMGGDPEVLDRLRSQAASGGLATPWILLGGPFLDGAGEPPVFAAVGDPESARHRVAELAGSGVDFVKVQARLEPEVHAAILEAAGEHGLPVYGHVPDALDAVTVARSGQRSIEHVSPALPSDAGLLFACSPREAELREELVSIGRDSAAADADRASLLARTAALREALLEERTPASCRALFTALKEGPVWVVPTLIWSQLVLPQGPDDLADFALDVLPSEWSQPRVEGRRRYVDGVPPERLAHHRLVAAGSRRFVSDLFDAGVGVVAGSDGFNGFTLPGDSLHRELALLVEAGLSPTDALRSATLETARMLGLVGETGEVAVGRVADLVLVEKNPLQDVARLREIRAVVREGRVVFRAPAAP